MPSSAGPVFPRIPLSSKLGDLSCVAARKGLPLRAWQFQRDRGIGALAQLRPTVSAETLEASDVPVKIGGQVTKDFSRPSLTVVACDGHTEPIRQGLRARDHNQTSFRRSAYCSC